MTLPDLNPGSPFVKKAQNVVGVIAAIGFAAVVAYAMFDKKASTSIDSK